MVSFALVAMFAIMGLALDIGWSYYVEKSAQAAADAAALAAVSAAMASGSAHDCGAVSCASAPVACPGAPGNLASACLYARTNGFDPAVKPAVTVTVQASDANTAPTVAGCTPVVQHPPTAPCVDTQYWVTVRVSEQVPQLFSAVMGKTTGKVSARATAAIVRSEAIGSLILLNRENDAWAGSTGRNLENGGGPDLIVPGGIILGSNSSSAGYAWGSSDVVSPFTWVRPGGGRVVGGAATWDPAPTTRADGSPFSDPFRNRPQVPINTNQDSIADIPVPDGKLNATVCGADLICDPGNYYAVHQDKDGNWIPTGDPIVVDPGNNGQLTFAGGGTNFANGDYVFFGGMEIHTGTINFGAGRYVYAGVKTAGYPVFSVDNGVTLLGGNGLASDPGRAFIFTDSSYEGRLSQVAAGISNLPDLQNFGHVSMQAGQNSQSKVELFGLNPANSEIQTLGLEDYPVVLWQDRMNSNVKYDSNGNLDFSSCGGTINAPCTNTNSSARGFEIQASPYSKYGGVIYQPRGAWMTMSGGGTSTGALQIITGALTMQGGGQITLSSPSTPVTLLVTALVE